jgi:hypothetical protein
MQGMAMQGMATQLLAIPMFVIFTLLPGAWVAYGFRLDALRWPARLALSGALSPVVLAAQMVALKAVGIPFAYIPTLLFIGNLPVLILIARAVDNDQPEDRSRSRGALIGGGLFFGILALYLLIPWQLVQNFRPFAWHALWHTDITYALTRNTLLPEEPELAGLTLAYGWVGHAYWSVLGWSSNLPPTITYAVSNLIWLLFTFLLAYEVAVSGFRLGRQAALMSVGLTCLGTNALGAVAWTLEQDWHWRSEFLGDIRYTPLLSKYLGFETMPFAFALLLAVTLLSVVAVQQPVRQLAAPLAITLTGLGLIYPILLPVGCLLAGALWLLLVTRLDQKAAIYSWRTLSWVAAGVAASVFLSFAFLALVTQDRSTSAIHLSTIEAIWPKLYHLVSALLLFTPALLPLGGALIKRNAPVLLLAAAGVGTMVLYVIADLDKLEYKYMLAATIVLAPLAADGIDWVLYRRPTVQWGLTFATVISLFMINQALMLRVGAQIPENLVHAPPLREDRFWVGLGPADANADWTNALRLLTSDDTILVVNQSTIHISAFAGRSLYAPSDIDGTATTGYSVDNRFNLLTWRGYPPQLYEERLALVQTLYTTTSVAKMQATVAQLLTLQRPVAIHFTPDIPLYQWLSTEGIGTELFADRTQVVWLLEANALDGATQHATN